MGGVSDLQTKDHITFSAMGRERRNEGRSAGKVWCNSVGVVGGKGRVLEVFGS